MATLVVDHLNDIVASYEGHPGPLPPIKIPTSLPMHNAFEIADELYIYSWDDRVEKSLCFGFGDLQITREIENNLGTDVGIIPCFWGDIRMRDHDDNNGI